MKLVTFDLANGQRHIGALMPGEGVLDGERVQGELRGDGGDFLLGRAVETDPRHAVVVAHVLEGLAEVHRILDPAAVHVHDRIRIQILCTDGDAAGCPVGGDRDLECLGI